MKRLALAALLLAVSAVAAMAAREAPASVTALPYNSKVLLSWAPSADPQVTGYNIYRSMQPVTSTAALIMQKAGLQMFDDNAVNLVGYFYWVRSLYQGEGDFSAPVSVTPYASPYAPAAAGVSSVSSTVVTFTWSLSAARGSYDPAKYYITRGTDPSALSYITATAATADTWSDTVPAAGSLYYYGIALIDVYDHMSNTAVISAYVPGLPSKPSGATGEGNAVSARISWDANPAFESVTGYNIYKDGAPAAFAFTPDTSYNDTAVVESEVHTYTVRAVSGAGESADSDTVTVGVFCRAPVISDSSGITQEPGQVMLSWSESDASEGVTGYNVYRSAVPGSYDYSNPLDVTGTAYYYDQPPVPGQGYYYRVSAFKSSNGYISGEKKLSSVIMPAPVSPVAAAGFNTYVSLSWADDPAYASSGYRVFYAADTAGDFQPLTFTANTYASVTGLANGTGYRFMVMRQNAYGESDTVNAYFVSAAPLPAATPEAVMSPAAASPGDGTVVLTWSAAAAGSGVTAYNVYRATSPGGYAGQPVGVTLTAVSFTDDPPSMGTDYYYVIRAVAASEGSASAEVSAKPYKRPAPPNNTTGSNTGGTAVLTWDAGDYLGTYQTEFTYKIYRTSALSASFNAIGFVTVTAGSYGYFTDSSVNTYSAYYYRVKGCDTTGMEDTNETNTVITPSSVLAPPAVLVAVAGDAKVTLIWRKITPLYYNIYRRVEGGSFGAPIAYNIAFGSKEYEDTTVTNGLRYYYAIKAVNAGGEGPASNEAMAVPYVAVGFLADSDRNVSAQVVNKKEISLTWNPPTDPGTYGVDSYLVYRSSDSGGTYMLQTATAAAAYLDAATSWDQDYWYLVKAVDGRGNTDAVYNMVKVELPLPANKLRVFRNTINFADSDTANDSAAIRYFITQKGKVRVRIHTLSGAFVRQLCEEDVEQDLSTDNPLESPDLVWDGTNAAGRRVAAGVYLIVLEADRNRVIEKIAVVR